MGNFSWGGRNLGHDHMHGPPMSYLKIMWILVWAVAFGAMLIAIARL